MAAMTLETLRVAIRAETSKYKADLKQAEATTVSSANRMKSALDAVKTALGAVGIVTGAVMAIRKLVDLGRESLELASDLEEVQNVVDVTFGSMSQQIDDFASDAITQFGLSRTAAARYASTMGAMLKSMGINGQELTDMSTELAGLAGDLASFYNIDADTAFQKLRAGITGEIEPLRQLGINLSAANLEQFRLSQGIDTAYNAMTEAEKAVLRYNYILSQTADAQGDFSRTSDGWANQVRIMREQINAIKAEIGSGLMEIMLPIVQSINWLLSKVIAGLQTLRRFFGRPAGSKGMTTMTDATAGLTEEANAAAGAIGGIGKAATKAAKAFTTSSFDELHQLTNPNSGSSGGGGGGGGGGAFSGIIDDLEAELLATEAAGNAIDELQEKNQHFADWISKHTQSWRLTDEQVAGYNAQQQATTDAWAGVGRGLKNAWQNMIDAETTRARGELISQAAMGQVRQNGRKFLNGVSSFITGSNAAREGMRNFNEAAIGGWHDLAVELGILQDEAEESTDRVGGAFVGAQDKIAGAAGSIQKKLAALANDQSLKDLEKNIGGVGSKATATATAVDAAGRTITERMRAMNSDSAKPISDFVTKEGSIGTGMTNAANTVKNGANNVVASMKAMNSDGGKQADALKSTITSKLNEAASNANSSGNSIKNSIVNSVMSAKNDLSASKFADVGKNITDGLISGMGDFKGKLDQWAGQFKKRILDNFNIKSPSKWMRDEVGWYLGLGLAEGMDDSEERILATCDSIAAAMAGSLNGSIPALSAAAAGITGGGWVDHMATTIAQTFNAGNNQQNQQPIVCEVYLDRDRIASAVSKGQQANNRRYSSTAMA